MSVIERYRVLFEHEKDANGKMLTMLESVPDANRGDARFQQAVSLAGHLAACRENWLDRMAGDGSTQVPWIDPGCSLSELRSRYSLLENAWTEYLAKLNDQQLEQEFKFVDWDDEISGWKVEVQVVNLFGHASYHRGQIALLVDQLGGETVDTDYVFWAVPESAG